MAKDGSYEVNLFKASWQDGALQEDVVKSVANGQIGFSKALASKWIRIDKTEEKPRIYRNVSAWNPKCSIVHVIGIPSEIVLVTIRTCASYRAHLRHFDLA